MEKLKAGERFNEVAAKFSEDKARQGVSDGMRYTANSSYFSHVFYAYSMSIVCCKLLPTALTAVIKSDLLVSNANFSPVFDTTSYIDA